MHYFLFTWTGNKLIVEDMLYNKLQLNSKVSSKSSFLLPPLSPNRKKFVPIYYSLLQITAYWGFVTLVGILRMYYFIFLVLFSNQQSCHLLIIWNDLVQLNFSALFYSNAFIWYIWHIGLSACLLKVFSHSSARFGCCYIISFLPWTIFLFKKKFLTFIFQNTKKESSM